MAALLGFGAAVAERVGHVDLPAAAAAFRDTGAEEMALCTRLACNFFVSFPTPIQLWMGSGIRTIAIGIRAGNQPHLLCRIRNAAIVHAHATVGSLFWRFSGLDIPVFESVKTQRSWASVNVQLIHGND